MNAMNARTASTAQEVKGFAVTAENIAEVFSAMQMVDLGFTVALKGQTVKLHGEPVFFAAEYRGDQTATEAEFEAFEKWMALGGWSYGHKVGAWWKSCAPAAAESLPGDTPEEYAARVEAVRAERADKDAQFDAEGAYWFGLAREARQAMAATTAA